MKKKGKRKMPTFLKDRWNPMDNTRPQTFKDRKKEASRKACRRGNYES